MSGCKISQTRRDVLKTVAGTAALLAPGVFLVAAPAPSKARPEDSMAQPSVRWGLLIDTNRCDQECTACVTACKEEMRLPSHGRPASDPQYIRKVELAEPKTGFTRSLPVMCQHCTNPPCADVCPTGASFKRADGIVLVDRHICIGCRYCMMACPYKARSFAHEAQTGQAPHNPRGKGCVEACTLCVHRVDAGVVPACVEACHAKGRGAMLFGDLMNPEHAITQVVAQYPTSQIRADLKTDPGIRYHGI
ncbi:MAG: 4Fe-4S dicluster domain-containing protein [Alphaproteobacteria bacterium]|nr:4Fe-4S dicluster domain-containing protein [Alphaproteobacteria bacterium]